MIRGYRTEFSAARMDNMWQDPKARTSFGCSGHSRKIRMVGVS